MSVTMSLVVSLENLRGLGALGDRIARVIFRGKKADYVFML